ncbi:MAG: bifunctional glutamate N-acetyltransferase/amino-acid acetyltransferase ArgJ [Phycisphaerae bacterium]|nr:bifunctional glutamate N-acetyltransferase/amino-acid acetyltransferase ArgJ [Phycisphaerae bacterium]
MKKSRHITLPKGFVAAGVTCGLKGSGGKDLAIIAGQEDLAAAMLTTRNQVVGAPVLHNRAILPRGCGRVRALVINSGNSNACTGKAGLADARATAAAAARQVGTDARKILVASTGIIGRRLPMDKIRKGVAAAAKALSRRNDRNVLRAMMTTDRREKSAVARLQIGGRKITIAGIVKGSGMIAPSLATMIGVITTDAAVTPPALHKALVAAARTSFDAITIDGDTSTSDTVVLLASGAAGNKSITGGSPGLGKFGAAVGDLCGALARAVVADGEGATKVIEVTVCGARSAREAEIAARSVANSPLVKCAVHGCDPNWGRIAMALGKSAANVRADKLSVRIGAAMVFSRGRPRRFEAHRVARYMRGKTVKIICDLGLGKGAYTALTCDLSRDYVTINAYYHT